MHQYSFTTYVNGAGPFDADVAYKDYPSIMKQYGLNGYPKPQNAVCNHDSHDIYGNCLMCDQYVGHCYSAEHCTICGVMCNHSYSNGFCTACGKEAPVYAPEVTAKSFTLSFEDEILVNFYYTISDTRHVTEQGMLVFDTNPGTADVAAASKVYPNALYDEVKGLYVPFWLFDAEVDGHVRYRGTRVRSWGDSEYIYTETSFYSITRGGNIGFERVPVDGSTRMLDELMESLEPFDFSEAVDFQTAYLAGYLADKYDVTAEESMEKANIRIKNSTEDILKSTISRTYTSLIRESGNVRIQNGKAKYALYPVWVLTTKWQGNTYLFAMNGQTGKFVGELPVDKGAYWKYWGMFTAAFAAIAFVISMFIR
jgi:hypothetical protein